MRLLVIFDGWIEKLGNFVGTERDSVREGRICIGAGGVVWWVYLGQRGKTAETGRGCAHGECLRLSLRGDAVMGD